MFGNRQKELSPQIKITDNHANWELCPRTERRLVNAIEGDEVMYVNRYFLVKFRGKMAGLALDDVKFANGSSIDAGTWYTPIDLEIRQRLREAYDRGERQVTLPEETTWVRMSSLNDKSFGTAGQLLRRAWIAASELASSPRKDQNVDRQRQREIIQDTIGWGSHGESVY